MKSTSRAIRALMLGLLVLVLASCGEGPAPIAEPTTAPESAGQSEIATDDSVRALGTIWPAQQITLSFLVGGPILVNNVQIGHKVQAGELLAALDTADLEFAVQKAEDTLTVSQAQLLQAQAGPQEQAVAVAMARYQQAQEQYEQARVQYAQAQSLHERELSQIHPEEVAIAEAQYRAALARYEQVKAGASPEALTAAQTQVQKAEVALQRAQSAYDRIAVQPDVGARPEAAALQEATIDYQAAVSEYERLKNLPAEWAIREAQASVDQAAARLRLAQAEPLAEHEEPSSGEIAVAQAQLDLAKSGPGSEDVAVVEAQVEQARTALAYAKLALARSELRAPFDGTVSAVYLHAGEWAAPGAPVVELLDTTGWLVETRNVGELPIGRVKAGQRATVRVMAFRSQELPGRVLAISPVAVVQQGDTTYTVMIELNATDLNLRPGMNAEVEILTE
jgi:multidrug resistance efflux pump